MNNGTYKAAQTSFDEIDKLLKEGKIPPEQIEHFETLRSQLAGVLARPFLPEGWGRRVIMIFIFLIGIYGMIYGPALLLLTWILLLISSPRIVGEFLFAYGKLIRRFRTIKNS